MTSGEPTGPKFPEVEVQLTGQDGNGAFIIGTVSKALRRAGHGDQVSAFTAEAMDGDYNALLRTCMAWVTVS